MRIQFSSAKELYVRLARKTWIGVLSLVLHPEKAKPFSVSRKLVFFDAMDVEKRVPGTGLISLIPCSPS